MRACKLWTQYNYSQLQKKITVPGIKGPFFLEHVNAPPPTRKILAKGPESNV